jgi:hypothetical protein
MLGSKSGGIPTPVCVLSFQQKLRTAPLLPFGSFLSPVGYELRDYPGDQADNNDPKEVHRQNLLVCGA